MCNVFMKQLAKTHWQSTHFEGNCHNKLSEHVDFRSNKITLRNRMWRTSCLETWRAVVMCCCSNRAKTAGKWILPILTNHWENGPDEKCIFLKTAVVSCFHITFSAPVSNKSRWFKGFFWPWGDASSMVGGAVPLAGF